MAVAKQLPVIAICALISFALLGALVTNGVTLPIDSNVLRFVNSTVPSTLNRLVVAITQLGRPEILFPVGALLFAALYTRKRHMQAMVVFVLFAGTGALTSLLKLIYDRVRPELWARPAYESSMSFPSGHASTTMIISLTLLWLLWPRRRLRPYLVAGSIIYIIAIGFTRLYLGVHYPSDIIAGWLLAVGWFAATIFCYQKFRARSAPR